MVASTKSKPLPYRGKMPRLLRTLFLVVLLYGIAGQQSLLAQGRTLNDDSAIALNNYVDYINDNIHALWTFHAKFRRFNSDLAIYFLVPYDRRNGREPYFVHENYLLNTKNYIRSIDQSYVKALKESSYIPSQFRSDLNHKLKSIRQTMDDIVLTSRDVQAYTQNRVYADDDKLEEGFALLQKIEDLFNEFNESKDDLYFTLEAAYLSYNTPNSKNPYIRHSEQLKSLVENSRVVMQHTRNKNKAAARRATDLLQASIKDVQRKENESLHGGVRIYDENRPKSDEPYVRYDFVLLQAKKIADYGKQYAQIDTLSEKQIKEFGPYDPAFYFYNKRMTSSFNRYGRGVVLQYNKYVDSAKVHLLKLTEEAHWFETAPISRFKSEQTELENYLAEQDADRPDRPKAKVVKVSDPDASPLEGYAANNLIFLLDVSSSMNQPEKIELLKNSVKRLQGLMRPEDHIAIIKYSGEATVVLPPTSSTNQDVIYHAIDNLEPGGKSDVEGGLKLAYSVMEKNFISSGNNKIILASDGDFEVPKRMMRTIKNNGDAEKMLSIFYFGKTEKEEMRTMLQGMTNAGSGNYSYVKEENANAILLEEARRIRN